MGFPAENFEAIYRNDIDDVVRMLNEKHKDHYKVYNLCKEKHYDHAKFGKRVERYPIHDHQPPKLVFMSEFCRDVDQWLRECSENVAVIHCKAGKGRTGVMISAYLLFTGQCKTVEEALNFYAEKRTKNTHGVTIPSQRRCVYDFDRILRNNCKYQSIKMRLEAIRFEGSFLGGSCPDGYTVNMENEKVYKSGDFHVLMRQNPSSCVWKVEDDAVVEVQDDVRIVFHTSNLVQKREPLFSVCFNTYMLCPHSFATWQCIGVEDNGKLANSMMANKNGPIKSAKCSVAEDSTGFCQKQCSVTRHHFVLTRNELDVEHKKNPVKHFSEDFKVSCILQCYNPAHHFPIPPCPSRDMIRQSASLAPPTDFISQPSSSRRHPRDNHSSSSSSSSACCTEDEDESDEDMAVYAASVAHDVVSPAPSTLSSQNRSSPRSDQSKSEEVLRPPHVQVKRHSLHICRAWGVGAGLGECYTQILILKD